MPDQIFNKLDAYLDGELDRRGEIEVQAHLETCQTCRDELEELRQLSHLLSLAPQPDFTSTPDFMAHLMLQLPRRAEVMEPRPGSWMLFWVAPFVVLAGFIFIQVTLNLSTLVSLASRAGFLDGTAAWANSVPQQMHWFTAAQATIGGILSLDGQTGLGFLNGANLFAQNLVIIILWQVGAVVLYFASLGLLLYKSKFVLKGTLR